MSILIKGMEMPNKKNGAVLIIYSDGKCAFEDGKTYQAVPVPTHGRLIDADSFLAIVNDSTILSDFLKCIINPLIRGEHTVIEAEEGE